MATPRLSPLFSTDGAGLLLAVKAAPKSSRNAILGTMPTVDGAALKVAVTAPADKGKANEAVVAVIAKAFGVAKGAVSIVSGDTDRRKLLRIAGDPAALTHIVQQWMSS